MTESPGGDHPPCQGDFAAGAGRHGDDWAIAAPATAAGRAAIAVVRLCGPGTKALLERVFRPAGGTHATPLQALPRTLVYGAFLDREGTIIDRGMAVFFPAQSSPTGTDYGELHLHGSPAIVRLVLEACHAAGARAARPGEFLQTAYLNGRISLVQAEAVAAAIASSTAAAARAAARSLEGGLGRTIAKIRETIIEAAALLEAAIDFPDEDLPAIDLARVEALLDGASTSVAGLLGTARRALLLHSGARVVLAGAPNAGKSSLFNALLGRERAIVAPEPGTTRDTLEAVIDIDGVPVTLVDTAGLRDTPDAIEREGVRRTRLELEHADCVLHLQPCDQLNNPASKSPEPMAAADVPVIKLITKADLAPDLLLGAETNRTGDSPKDVLAVSAATGRGLDELHLLLAATLRGDATDDASARSGRQASETLLTHERQKTALEETAAALAEARTGLHQRLPAELLAIHLRDALEPLDALLGTRADEEILSAVFSRFCIGK